MLDSSGQGHHGTAEPGLLYADAAGTSVGLDFRDTEARVRIPDDPGFHLQDGFTLEAYLWLDRVGPGSPSKRYLVFRGDCRPGRDPWWLAVNQDGGLAVQVWGGAESVRLDSADPIPLRQWVHIAGTLDPATGALSLFLNHEMIAQRDRAPAPAAALIASEQPAVVLGNSDFTSEGVHAVLDDVRITARALEPSEFLPIIGPAAPTWTATASSQSSTASRSRGTSGSGISGLTSMAMRHGRCSTFWNFRHRSVAAVIDRET